MQHESVAVIVAAKDAAGTIARAIRSALAEPEVSQVIVVDDGSTDGTSEVARTADDGSGRLRIERFAENRGPSTARNRALDVVRASHVAILDADDVLVPGRFARLFAVQGWDMIADNLAFVPEDAVLDEVPLPAPLGRTRTLTTAQFIEGCVSRTSRIRSQLGFLKPLLRVDLLTTAGLRYDEEVRLGEDFLLYVELLRRGSRMMLLEDVGYIAVERHNSLSARHKTQDLRALLDAERALQNILDPGSPESRQMKLRVSDTAAKYRLRAFLDAKRAGGLRGGVTWLARRPAAWRDVVLGVARDKLHAAKPPKPSSSPAVRLLLPTPDAR